MITHMGINGAVLAALLTGTVFGLGIGVGIGIDARSWWSRRRRGRAEVSHRDHAYHDCPGCGGPVVQARTRQRTYRFFDARPRPVVTVGRPLQAGDGEATGSVEQRRREADRDAGANAELWVFDPWDDGAMIPYNDRTTATGQGLVEHFCALGVKEPPADLRPQDRVPWRMPAPEAGAA